MNKFDNFVGMLGVTVGLVGLGYALGMHSKMAKISDNLDRSIEELASNMPVDIPNNMVERAVEKAVAYEVKQSVHKVTDKAVAEVKRDIHKQVSDVIESEYSNIKETVLAELVEEAANIDAKRVRHDVEKAAKEHALKKFDDNLDDILEDYKKDLAQVAKIHKSYADMMAPAAPKETILRIG